MSVDLDALFDSKSDADTIEADVEAGEHEETGNGIGWKALALFICGGAVITALVVAFMVWVIEGLVL
jgi:hypothetical protein